MILMRFGVSGLFLLPFWIGSGLLSLAVVVQQVHQVGLGDEAAQLDQVACYDAE